MNFAKAAAAGMIAAVGLSAAATERRHITVGVLVALRGRLPGANTTAYWLFAVHAGLVARLRQIARATTAMIGARLRRAPRGGIAAATLRQ